MLQGYLEISADGVVASNVECYFLTPAHKGWGYSRHLRQAAVGIKLVGVPQPKPLYRFSPNFQGMFIPRESRAD